MFNDNNIMITKMVAKNSGVVNGFCQRLFITVASININIVMAAPK